MFMSHANDNKRNDEAGYGPKLDVAGIRGCGSPLLFGSTNAFMIAFWCVVFGNLTYHL